MLSRCSEAEPIRACVSRENGAVAQPIRSFNAATTQIVTGLTNAITYTFRVAAGNAAGLSAQSAPSSPVTVGAPLEPTVVAVAKPSAPSAAATG
jgi:hypothetical protein